MTQIKLRVAPLTRAAAEGRDLAMNKAANKRFASDDSDSEADEGELDFAMLFRSLVSAVLCFVREQCCCCVEDTLSEVGTLTTGSLSRSVRSCWPWTRPHPGGCGFTAAWLQAFSTAWGEAAATPGVRESISQPASSLWGKLPVVRVYTARHKQGQLELCPW